LEIEIMFRAAQDSTARVHAGRVIAGLHEFHPTLCGSLHTPAVDGPSANERRVPEPVRLSVEDLLDEAAWVRALASRLVCGRAADADDVEQDTWVAALEHAPRDPAHRRSWLARVATNFARLKSRGDAHRTQREIQAARPEGQPSASETLERLEAQRALVDALRALDEPYRTTVMRRYFDGLSAADIARAENVPASTVRWRLMHGIEALRARLDEKYGDRAAWSLAFVPLIKPHVSLTTAAAATGGAALTGVLVMNAVTRTALVAALVVSGSLGVWLVVRPAADPAVPTVKADEPARLAAPLVQDVHAPTTLVDASVNEARAAATSGAAPATADAAAIAAMSAHIDGRFVDADGRALAGVHIERPLGPDHNFVMSDAKGAFDILIPLCPPSGNMSFEARCAGWANFYATCAPRPGQTQHMGNIVLEPGGAIAGVVLGPDGAPVAGAQIMALNPKIEDEYDSARRNGPGSVHAPEATSTADGSFRIEGVAAQLARAWAHAPGMRWTISDPIEVPRNAVHAGLEMRLEPLSADDRIEGIVLDPKGTPLSNVSVNYECSAPGAGWSAATQTGDDGRFQILLPRKFATNLFVLDPERRWLAVRKKDVPPGTLDVVLRFAEPQRALLVVKGPHEDPVSMFDAVLDRPGSRGDAIWGSSTADIHEGTLLFPVPDGEFVIVVSARGHEEKKLGPFAPGSVGKRLECTLRELPGIRGRVTAGGEPKSGAHVEVREVVQGSLHITQNGWLLRLNPNVVDTTQSDEQGEFALTVRKAGRYALLCDDEEHTRAEVGPFDVDPQIGVSSVEVKLGRGGAIEGRVLVPSGRDPGGVLVGITRHDGFPRTLRTGSEGTFRFEGLTPGGWQVKRLVREDDPASSGTSFRSGGKPVEFPIDLQVEEGKTTRFDLDLRKTFDVVLAGHVSVNGKPAAGWTVLVLPDVEAGHSTEIPGGSVDERGDVRVSMAAPGKVRVVLRSSASGEVPVEIERVLDLVGGDNPWVVDLDAGGIQGHASPEKNLTYEWLDGGDAACRVDFAPAPDGRYRLALVPAGKGRLTMRDKSTHAELEHRDVLVKRGEMLDFDLP
jgi:RNA polymerase sigma-70 factor (ECF subfamily)